MSLYTVAQAEAGFTLATNLDTSSTEKVNASGLNVSSAQYGTVTQNASSLTGNASYDFGSDGRVLHQWGASYGINNFIHEIVFKKSSTPSEEVYLFSSLQTTSLRITSNGYIKASYNTPSYGGNTITGTTNLCDGKFHHVVISYNDGSAGFRLYVDGVLIGTKTTLGNLNYSGYVNLGSYSNTSGTSPSLYSQATIDFYAFYQGDIKTNAQMDTFVANHMATFADRTVSATVSTASALAVQPSVFISSTITASPLTASAASGDHYNSTRDSFTLLDGYMGTLSLEQWYKFDDEKNIINYGSGGAAGYVFNGNSTSNDHGGIQGSGSLQFCGTTADGDVSILLDDYATLSPELTDYDFSIGFWIKASSAIESYNPSVYNFGNYVGNYMGFILHNSGKLEFQAYSNQPHYVQTASSICDNNWHLVVGKYDGSTMSLYVDNTLIGTASVNSNQLGDPWTYAGFGNNNETATNTPLYLSNFFISSHSAITTTVMGNMMTYATPKSLQGYANMEMPKFSSNNSFNNLTETRGALVDLRFNESSGSPANYGTTSGINLSLTGDAVTYNQLSPNTKAFKINSTNTKISTIADFPAGTFSTNNDQTLMVYAKVDSGSEPAVINIFATAGHFGGPFGSGLGLFMLGSGQIRARLRDGAGSNTINSAGSYADSKYHLYTATTDGSTVKLYIDGILEGSTSTDKTLTDSGLLMIGGEGDTFGLWDESKSTYIDEVSVYNSAFTAEQVFNHFQALSWPMDWTATAALPAPAVSAGYGPTINATALTATAAMGPVFPPIAPAIANTLFLNPNYEAIKNASNAADPMTASAQAENPGWNIGEENQVLHMDASAAMGDARALIPGFWNASPAIANPAEMVMPAFSSTRGARIVAQSIPAQAIFVTPPAYKLITDDIWYQKLYLQHSILNGERWKTDNLPGTGTSSASAFLKLFDDVTQSLGGANTNKIINNLPRSIVIDTPTNTDTATQYAIATNAFQTATPTPLLEVGTFDDYERKSVRFRNIQFEIPENNYVSNNGYSLEFTFKSTKANQVIAQGFQQSFLYYQSATSSIGLIDGKLYATRATQPIGKPKIFAHPDNEKLVTTVTAYGNKSIADGAWHHVIIQYGFDGRVQFWIDGELDIQFFADNNFAAGAGIRPYIIGSNHSNSRWQSDFETSAWSYDAAFFVDSNDITEHYTASIKYEPIHPEPATATAEVGQDSKAEGNRGRALMLYFWPTAAEQTGTPFGTGPYTSDESPDELTTLDYFTKPPQEYEGWDVFPVDVTGRWVSDLVKIEAYGGVENIGSTNFITYVGPWGDTKNAPYALYNKRRTFRDPLTDASRYIDLINDIDLSKFDMIMFKNYPNDPNEKDAFTGSEIVDAYFNLRESKIFEDFVKSLRAAVDTGISLMVANAQLALDLKIVDRVEVVPDMDDNIGQGNYSDPYAPTQMFDSAAAALPIPPQYDEPLGWEDTWKNNRTRIVNIHPGITDYPALVKTQEAYWVSTDEYRWGGPDRMFVKYEHKNALAVGDEFVISTTGLRADNNRAGYLATPFANVKAGKIITAFANTVRRGLDLIDNPYKNYAQSIILEPGDVLDGRQVGGRIYVNFTEEINKCQETGAIELTSDYWVNYAYENGAIDLAARDDLLQQEFVKTETPYWSVNGLNLLQQVGAKYELDTDFEKAGVQKKAVKTRKINKNGGLSFQSVPTGGVFFSSTYSWAYPMVNFEVPSMPTRGFRWLSNREVLEGTVIRQVSMDATAQMPNALAVPDKVTQFNAQSMVAAATITETNFTSGTTKILVLPMEANATIVKPGSTIAIPVMTANAGMFANSRAKVASEDQVVLQIIHVDPILYIREDVIK